MKITAEQYRNVYVLFVGLFALNLGVTLFNTYQNHKLRKLQKKELNSRIQQQNV